MSKRKVNFGAITSEAARRQLMVPTPCWERVLAMPEDVTPGTTWKVYKWVKTDRQQIFEEEEVDQPLAPLHDVEEVETNEEDAENAEDTPAEENSESQAVSEPPQAKDSTSSRPVTPKPHPLSVSFQPPSPTPAPQGDENIEVDTEAFMATATLDHGLVAEVGDLNPDDIMHMDMTDLVPGSEAFEGAVDLLQGGDGLLQLQNGDGLLQVQGGDDLLQVQGGEDLLQVQGGDDLLQVQGGEDLLQVQGGDDLLQVQGGDDLLQVQNGGDLLQVQEGGDLLDGVELMDQTGDPFQVDVQ